MNAFSDQPVWPVRQEKRSLSIMSALIWPQGMDKEKWGRVCGSEWSLLQEVLFRCYIPLCVQRLPAQFLLQFKFCVLTAYTWQCCCTIPAFVLCSHCLDRGGEVQLPREQLSGADKLRPALLWNTLTGTSGVKEPEGLQLVCGCVCVCVLQE